MRVFDDLTLPPSWIKLGGRSIEGADATQVSAMIREALKL